MNQLLLVEDDPVLGKSLQVALELEGYTTSWATTMKAASTALQKQKFDLLLLDLNLPDGSGLTLAKESQELEPNLPILMITASGDEDSVVAGFEAGATDYVRKPFSNRELSMRIRALLRRAPRASEKSLQFGDLSIQLDKRIVRYGERKVELNRREFDIFCHFMGNAENVVTRENLLKLLNKEGEIFDRTIDSHVSHLRTRLRQAGIDSVQISPVYGVGYRLEKRC